MTLSYKCGCRFNLGTIDKSILGCEKCEKCRDCRKKGIASGLLRLPHNPPA